MGRSAGQSVAFTEHGIISVAIQGVGEVEKQTGTMGQAFTKMQMEALEQGKAVSDELDSYSQQSFNKLEKNLRQSSQHAKMATDEVRDHSRSSRPPPPARRPTRRVDTLLRGMPHHRLTVVFYGRVTQRAVSEITLIDRRTATRRRLHRVIVTFELQALVSRTIIAVVAARLLRLG